MNLAILKNLLSSQLSINFSHFLKTSNLRRIPRIQATFTTSAKCFDLNEFFDKKSNWGETKVLVGRPWKKEELRLKSNSDLHKLWYVLLKERNAIMTMEAEYERKNELFPNPERFEKVEESMENLLEVVAERDKVVNLLETGEEGLPGKRWAYNQLGIGFWRKCREHLVPIKVQFADRYPNAPGKGAWQNKYLRLLREKRLRERAFENRMNRYAGMKLERAFDGLEVERPAQKTERLRDKMRGP